jgi:hypothetical protein
MQLLTAEVKFPAQGKDYSVKLSTLTSIQTQPGGLTPQPATPTTAMNSQ